MGDERDVGPGRPRLMTCFAAALLAVSVSHLGCAAAPLEAPVSVPAPAAEAPLPALEGEIGGMNEEAVGRAFDRLAAPIRRCIEAGASEVEPLGGHFELSLRIDRGGKARWAYVGASTLGHRATERCIADAARAHTWPRPVGGEGLARRAFDIEPGALATEWSERRVRAAVRGANAQLAKCKRGVSGAFVATAYVRPDGRVLAVGVSPPSESAEPAADCLASALGRLRFGSPGRKPAKVSFSV